MNVVQALFYLRLVSLRNAVRTRLLRLKQPKYLVGAIAGVAYLWLVLGGPGTTRRPGLSAGVPTDELVATVTAVTALGLMVLFALNWLLPRARAALVFSEPEIAFLFPAPLSRRGLIHYRLVSSQLAILFTVTILAILSRNWPAVSDTAAIRFVGLWIVIATIGLHGTGSSFVITRLLDRGVTPLRRSLITLGITAIVIAILVVPAWNVWRAPTPEELTGFGTMAAYVGELVQARPLAWVLAPATWIVRPLFAADAHTFALALAPALLVYAVHYLWVLRVNVPFEEASLDKAVQRAERLAAFRAGGTFRLSGRKQRARRDPFSLAAHGRPEIAFLWKNLLSTADYLRPRTALVAAAIITLVGIWFAIRPELAPVRVIIGTAAAGISAYVLFFGPFVARQDFRRDLLHADLLKTYPLPAWQIVLGQILAPVVILTSVLWLLLLAAAFLFPAPPPVTLPMRLAAVVALALVAPFVVGLQLFVANATTLLFPAWFGTAGQQRANQGIDRFGQQLIAVWGQLLVLAIALLPAGLLGLLFFFLTAWAAGTTVAIVAGAMAVAATLGAETGLGVWWLGKRFERFDLSVELRP